MPGALDTYQFPSFEEFKKQHPDILRNVSPYTTYLQEREKAARAVTPLFGPRKAGAMPGPSPYPEGSLEMAGPRGGWSSTETPRGLASTEAELAAAEELRRGRVFMGPPRLDAAPSAAAAPTAPALEPELIQGVKAASPEAKARAYAAVQAKGLNIDKIYNDALGAAKGPDPFNLRAAIDGYREKFKVKDETEFTKEEKSMLILELGMRMMNAAAQPGASTGGALSAAGMGTLGTYRGMQKDKRERALASEDRAERRALGEANIDLQQRALEDRALADRRATADSAVERAIKARELELRAEGTPIPFANEAGEMGAMYPGSGRTVFGVDEGKRVKGQRLGAGGGTVFDRALAYAQENNLFDGDKDKQAMWARGQKVMTATDLYIEASKRVDASIKATGSFVKPAERDQLIQAEQQKLQALQGEVAQPRGGPATAPPAGGAISAQLPPQAVDAVKGAAGKPVKFKNGQVWQWQNGQAVRVQ